MLREAIALHSPGTVALTLVCALGCALPTLVGAEEPASVTIAGSLQDELGCPGDWQPDCASTHLGLDAEDGVWQGVFSLPTGDFEYKAAIDDSWDENYGANATPNGSNIPVSLGAAGDVKFYYSDATHWVTDNATTTIAVAPGSFQSELGCAGDWDPGCLRSWLQDPDGDGVFSFRTRSLPAGDYEAKVAIGESWDENYGAGGIPGGANIAFNVPNDCTEMLFSFDSTTKVLTIEVAPPAPQPASVTIAGSLQDELGCAGDWQPDCAATHLIFDAEDGVWQNAFDLPAGAFEYKAAIDDSWDENYGANATPNGANIPLALADPTTVKLYYSDATHWVTDNATTAIAVVPGSFQSELGCAGDWDPACLRSWLQGPDGDGVFTFSARLPAGSYEAKVAHNESWDENYGDGGVPNGANIAFTVPTSCTEVFFNYVLASHVLTIGTAPGGPVGNLNQARAHWVDATTIAWNEGATDDVYTLHFAPDGGLTLDETGVVGGSTIALTVDAAGLGPGIVAAFPHLAGYRALKLDPADAALAPDILKGQIAVSVAAPDGTPRGATSVQIPGVLDDLYAYDGPLGVSYHGRRPTLRLWAPTARSVSLQLFADSDPATPPSTFAMTLDPQTGVWSVTGHPAWDRRFYRYDVEVYVPSTGQVEHNVVTDPYSVSLSADSARSQIVNLADHDLAPWGWSWTPKPRLDAPEDIVLYEIHIRDFSIADPTVAPWARGTFLAFAQPATAGMAHLAALARAGLTHVHLLPTFDFATVPERRDDQLEVDQELLATYPPDSDQQQAAIGAIKDRDGFNWGYDPWHYTVPEGSYASDPDGVTRIREFRSVVQGLNRIGLRVVMDVVYNHTTASGQDPRSVLDRIVPGYYHRLSLTGAVENSSCCSNTASEHAMMRKLLIDSVVTWARDYKVDGFRFDLMGHHMKADMLALRAALDGLTVAHDGVDGSKIYVYGEGWNFGEVADNARGVNATQRNMAGTGIGTFSDRLRDGVRGGNPFSDSRLQGFINGLWYDPNGLPQGDELGTLLHISDWVRIGLAGDLADYQLVDAAGDLVRADQVDYFGQPAGYTADPQEDITYIAAHDNQTLFDATQLKAPLTTTMADRVRIQNLGNSLVVLGQGIPFLHAGQELLRSKSMDRDSYNSGDWFNQIDWSLATSGWGHGLPTADKNLDQWPIMQPRLADPFLAPIPSDRARAGDHLREMLRIRKSTRLLRLETGDEIRQHLRFHNTGPTQVPGLIVMSVADDGGEIERRTELVVCLFNATADPVLFDLAEVAGRNLELHPALRTSSDPVVRSATFEAATGTFEVPARTTAVFVERRSAHEQLELLLADVDRLESTSALGTGHARFLRTTLEQALRFVDRNQPQRAIARLNLFSLHVRILERIGALGSTEADGLVHAAEDAIATLQE